MDISTVSTRDNFLASLSTSSVSLDIPPRDSGFDSEGPTPIDQRSGANSTVPLLVETPIPHYSPDFTDRVRRQESSPEERALFSPFSPFPEDGGPSELASLEARHFTQEILPGFTGIAISNPSPVRHSPPRPSKSTQGLNVFQETLLLEQNRRREALDTVSGVAEPSAIAIFVRGTHADVAKAFTQKLGMRATLASCISEDMDLIERVYELSINPFRCEHGLCDYVGRVALGTPVAMGDLVINSLFFVASTAAGTVGIVSSPLLAIPSVNQSCFGNHLKEVLHISKFTVRISSLEAFDSVIRAVPVAGPFLSYGAKWSMVAISKLWRRIF